MAAEQSNKAKDKSLTIASLQSSRASTSTADAWTLPKEMSALAGGLALRGAAWYWWAARRHAVETPLYAGPPLALPELGACGRRVNATLPTVACAAAYARRPAARDRRRAL